MLLNIIDKTLIVDALVLQVGGQCCGEVLSSPPTIYSCPSDSTFRSICTVHMLRRSLEYLLGIIRMPACSVCKAVNETIQDEINELVAMVDIRSLIPAQCVSIECWHNDKMFIISGILIFELFLF